MSLGLAHYPAHEDTWKLVPRPPRRRTAIEEERQPGETGDEDTKSKPELDGFELVGLVVEKVVREVDDREQRKENPTAE